MSRLTLAEAAKRALLTADATEKADVTAEMAAMWRNGEITEVGSTDLPDRPGRPAKPELLPPNKMPKRKKAAFRAASGFCMHWPISNLMPSIWRGIFAFGFPKPTCPSIFTMPGFRLPTTKPVISR